MTQKAPRNNATATAVKQKRSQLTALADSLRTASTAAMDERDEPHKIDGVGRASQRRRKVHLLGGTYVGQRTRVVADDVVLLHSYIERHKAQAQAAP